MDFNANVWQLKCKTCSQIITKRGCKTKLCSDQSTVIYSTDFVTKYITESCLEIRKFPLCDCQIRDIHCSKCNSNLGYHVIYPCQPCLIISNLHYWMIYEKEIIGEKIENLLWDEIDAIPYEDLPVVAENDIPNYLICTICYDILHDAVVLSCGHTFCRKCIMRVIDLNKKCPLDSIEMCSDLIFPNYFAREVIDNLRIHCRYGCVFTGGTWNAEQSLCQEIVKLGDRKKHENDCPFKLKK